MDKTSKMRSKLLPIYVVKRDSRNSRTLSQKKVNFQINFGKQYHINYKYFMPQGYHLASNSKADVPCEFNANGLTVPSITFTYVKDGSEDEPHRHDQPKSPKPIKVTYVDDDSHRQIKVGSANGGYGQTVDVTDQIAMPSQYHLCDGQKTRFQIGQYAQSVDLMVKHDPVKESASVIDRDHDGAPADDESSRNGQVSIQSLEDNLHKYNYGIAIQLVDRVMDHDLDFFKRVIMQIFANMKYKGINNLKITPDDQKVSGVIKKYLYNNNQVNFTFVRAKHNSAHDRIDVSEVRDFVTSVMDHNCSKGIFITTSDFTVEAKKEAERHSIILVNNMHLAKLMINNDVGVKPKRIIKVVDLDKNFFD